MSLPEQKKLTANTPAGGCAAKISASELAQILAGLPSFNCEQLLTSSQGFEDAAVYQLSDEQALIQTIDFFPPVIDDPFLYGRIAAVNALSDVYAMGGKPVIALNVLGFPVCDYPIEMAKEIIAGGAQAVVEAGAVIAGGHSIQTKEPIYGLSVCGFVHPQKILKNSGAQREDALVVCKPLGTGVALLALKGGLLSKPAHNELIASLCRLNAQCLQIAAQYSLHAATDITGFGLIGHSHEMAKASNACIRIDSQRVPLLTGSLEAAAMGLVPAGAYANRKAYSDWVHFSSAVDLAISDLFFDPQTSGGLFFALSHIEAEKLVQDLKAADWNAEIIGTVFHGERAGTVEVI